MYPRHAFGYSGAPKGQGGNANHFWGGPSYHYPMNQPWWRGRAFNSRARSGGSPYLPYYTPRDSYGGVGQGGGQPSSGSYYYSPPPLQGDWNLPKVTMMERICGAGSGPGVCVGWVHVWVCVGVFVVRACNGQHAVRSFVSRQNERVGSRLLGQR